MFAGTWADRRGRKLVMILPFIGQLLPYLCPQRDCRRNFKWPFNKKEGKA